jgi:hypothetical protein
MKHTDNMIRLVLGLLMVSGTLPCAWQADAAPIDLDLNSVNVFRDTRSANDVGLNQGDRITFSTSIRGGPPAGTTIGAKYPSVGPTVFIVPQILCNPGTAAPTLCGLTTSFNMNRLGSWKIRLENLPDFLEVDTPTLQGAEDPVPFPESVTMSGSGVTPTIAWEVPNSFVPDGIRVNIRDKNRPLPNGTADNIHSDNIDPALNSYEIPATLSTGLSLMPGGNYTIEIQLIETRNHGPLNNNSDILRRSNSFFAFTPIVGVMPPLVNLPTVVNGIYNFKFKIENPDSVTFIDPLVATGYDYQIGSGDPNFKSVLLPQVGDNFFDLYLWNGSAYVFRATVGSGVQFSFPPGGVDRFRVLGVEASAGLNPNNVTAFITGLTFVSAGQFTGTMTPITAEATCSTLGDDPKPSLLDQDIYTLQGTRGEELRVRLEELKDDNKANQASLILLDNIQGAFLLKTDNGTLPNEVSAFLPATGEYLIVVAEQPLIARGNRFRGDYCLSVRSSAGAAQTLQPTGWVEQ